MVPEGRRLFPEMTVIENLTIAGENGRKGSWTLKSVFEALPQLERIARDAAGGLIVVEQDLDRALGFADRIVCMLEGRIVLEGKPGDLARADIAAAYFGLGGEERVH